MAVQFNFEVSARLKKLEQYLRVDPANLPGHLEYLFMLDVAPGVTTAQQQKARRRWYEQIAYLSPKKYTSWTGSRDPDRPIKVGYVGGDFRRHSAFQCFSSIIFYRDRERIKNYIYSSTPPSLHDDATAVIKKHVDGFTDVYSFGSAALAKTIHDDGIDILIDLAGISWNNRLEAFALKPAPIQVSAWGYANGTQMDEMDYLFSDPVFIPESERYLYREKIIDLPCTVCFETLEHAPPVTACPVVAGAPFTFGSFNRVLKLSDECLKTFGELVAAVPGSRIIFKDMVFEASRTRRLFSEHIKKFGLHKNNTVLQGKTNRFEHLAAYGQLDLHLDSFPHTGGITTVEALIMGVPVVTLAGDTPTQRVSASILQSIGAGEWVTTVPAAYKAAALRAVNNPEWLARIRQAMRFIFTQHAVGDPNIYVPQVDAVYRRLWRKFCE